MSADQVPSRAEVMGWSPQQLASYLKKMNLSGCDKAVMKNSISGSRFVNLSDTDLQKFPKLHAPLISKISTEISKKEERRGLFGLRMTKYQEPVNPCPLPSAEVMDDGWGEEEFESEDDYESPYSGDEEGSGGDYESPNEDQDGANDYEPPPTEPPEDLPHTRCTNLPTGDYIDQRASLPPAISPRPPVPSLPAPSRKPGEPPRRDPSPHCGGRPSGSLPPEPPKIYRGNKPGKDPGSTPTRGPHRNTLATPGAQSWRPQQETPDPPSWSKPPVLPPTSSIGRSNSSARVPSARFERTEGRREQTNDDAPKHNTFPLQHKNMPPRSGLPGPPRHGDSLPPNVPKVHPGMGDLRVSSLGSDRQSFRPPLPSSSRSQEMDPRWYVGKVTRGQAEGCLKRVNKDGAYLVRDSTRQLENQPFTLMVCYQDKVFNIQIRQQNQQFLLGTGLKVQECFPTVSDIINHYSQSPLLLIDAKNRRSSQQNQCLLSDPAGFCMTGQNWS